MPFTLSHAVVALPFVRTPLVPGAIAMGAMSPDLPLFFPWAARYSVTHSWPTMFVVGVPIALVLWSTWRLILRPAAVALAPSVIGRRLPLEWTRPISRHNLWSQLWRRRRADARPLAASVAFVVVSLALGIASHVVWDMFTHEGRWGSDILPVLAERWGPLEGTQWIQHASSLVGLVIIAGWEWQNHRGTPVIDAPASSGSAWLGRLWLFALALCGIVAILLEVSINGVPDDWGSAPLFRAGTSAGAAMLATTLIVALFAGNQVKSERARTERK